MENTRKPKSASRSNGTKEKVKKTYQEYLQTEGKQPMSVFKFCKDIGIPEEEFYQYFASFGALEKGIWKDADPHPGNFIITEDKKLGVIDFGCVKVIPNEFYRSYFQLLDKDFLTDKENQAKVFRELRFIYDDDTAEDKDFFEKLFLKLVELLGRPFRTPSFDFSDKVYFNSLYKFSKEIGNIKALRESKKARGLKHALYINRTYYGLYSLLHDLKAKVDTTSFVNIAK